MALKPKKKITAPKNVKKATKASTGKITTTKTAATKTAATKTGAKKPAAKKSTIKKPAVSKTKQTSEIKKDIPMSTKENTHSEDVLKNGLGNAKLEQTGNIADKIWRLIAMTAFAFIGNFALLAIVVLSAMQFVVVFMEDKPNKEVQSIVTKLEKYLSQIFSFLSYKTDVMPFPFSGFPKSKD
jgi:high-affinity Fe2+/Pb2+ permease